MWKNTNLGAGTLVVKDVVHALWDLEETGEPKHMVCLYTEFIELEKPGKAHAAVAEPVSNN